MMIKPEPLNGRIHIGERCIEQGASPFIIAELSGNHQQSFDLAEKMIVAAAKAGAHAIKLQTYTADSMTLASDHENFVISEPDSLWHGRRLHELYQQAATPYDWHASLFELAKSLGLLAFSSPFDAAAVDFLEALDVPCYKIASFENNDIPLLRRIASTGKPVIMSCGMASLEELSQSVQTLTNAGCSELVLLKCTSAYPSPASDMNLATISDMAERFGCPVGLSDHSTGIDIALAATALGAPVIEKHFVLSRDDGGVDAAFSLEPLELAQLCVQSQRVHDAIGRVNYGDTDSDKTASRYRRSIYFSRPKQAGERVLEEDLAILRPASGLAPEHYDGLIGKRVLRNIEKGEACRLDMFE